jgi:hypothetical protein
MLVITEMEALKNNPQTGTVDGSTFLTASNWSNNFYDIVILSSCLPHSFVTPLCSIVCDLN